MSAARGIRRERADDGPAVRTVLQAAFGGPIEAEIVEELQASGDLVLALVAEQSGAIAGYLAFPRLELDLGERMVPVAGLAPIGVAPALQRQGIGAALIREGIARLADRGERLVFVLGAPDYYWRFGFRVTDEFVSDYAGPYFQALALAPDAPTAGRVFYPRAFRPALIPCRATSSRSNTTARRSPVGSGRTTRRRCSAC
jgi:putative acetyltransferase